MKAFTVTFDCTCGQRQDAQLLISPSRGHNLTLGACHRCQTQAGGIVDHVVHLAMAEAGEEVAIFVVMVCEGCKAERGTVIEHKAGESHAIELPNCPTCKTELTGIKDRRMVIAELAPARLL